MRFLDDVTDQLNLRWAWEKVRYASMPGDVWIDEIELAGFEVQLERNLQSIANEIRKGRYSLRPLRPMAFPKNPNKDGEQQVRQFFNIAVRDQVAWTAVVNVVGQHLDQLMPAWSYGNRLFRSIWVDEDDGVRRRKVGRYRHSSGRIPELSLPRTRLADFEKLVCALNVIAFVGVDYRLNPTTRQARNEGLVFIPAGFWKGRPSRTCTRIVFGKSHAAPGERSALKNLSPSWSHVGDDEVYVFDAEKYGRIGVSICYDFMDLERAVMYRGRVHHLFVLAYNRDLGMFRSLADSLSRTVFCNVIVCNTGFFGGSIAVSPYHDPHKRMLYSHDGNGLFTTQVVRLPVRGVEQALDGKVEKKTVKRREEKVFKDRPPGVGESVNLTPVSQTLNPPPF